MSRLSFNLIDTGWEEVLGSAAADEHSEIRLVCPFIKEGAARRLLLHGRPRILQVITRFDLNGFYSGVSDTDALRFFMDNGAQVRGVKNLHAKLYLFGETCAVVTSANLTDAGLSRNHEFGFSATEAEIVRRCREYFDALWGRAASNLDRSSLDRWDQQVESAKRTSPHHSTGPSLRDYGADVGIAASPIAPPPLIEEVRQAFVKFFATGAERELRNKSVIDEVKDTGCHWACSYPKSKRPRQVEDGAIMFIGSMVENPNDILIYGRAIGQSYQEGRDDATSDDVALRHWKSQWSRYVRVCNPEFLAGCLENGVSLNELMQSLGANAFASTQANAAKRRGNVNPRISIRRQPHVKLSAEGFLWLSAKLKAAFHQHGKLGRKEMECLDWQGSEPTRKGKGEKKGKRDILDY